MKYPEHIESAAVMLVMTSRGQLTLEAARMFITYERAMHAARPSLLSRLLAWLHSLCN